MDDFVIIGMGLAIFVFLFVMLLSWKWTVLFYLIVAVCGLHLLIPIEISLEQGVTVHGADLFFGAMAAATVLRLIVARKIDTARLLWLILSVYLLGAFVMGALSYGVLTALASYRSTFYLTVSVFYFGLFYYDRGNTIRLMDWVMLAGVFLFVAAIVLWLFPEWRPVNTSIYAMSVNVYERNRALPAQAAQFAAVGALIALSMWQIPDSGITRRMMAIPLLIVSIFLFHRTVWLMLAAGIVMTLVASGRNVVRTLLVLQGVIIALALLWLMLVALDLDFLSESLRTAVREAVDTDNNTLNWRVEGWQILVSRAIGQGPMTILFGSGFGLGFERTIRGSYISFNPHNYYVELFLTSGLVGTALFIFVSSYLLLAMLRRALRDKALEVLPLPGIIVGMMVYSGSYSPQYDLALLLGLALAQAGRPETTPNSPAAVSVVGKGGGGRGPWV